MLNIHCPECGAELPPSTTVCPRCGYPIRKPRPQAKWPDGRPRREFRESLTRNSVFGRYVAATFCIVVILLGLTVFIGYMIMA